MFKVNDTVIYGTEGVCRVMDITERMFRDKKIRYYVLKPVYKENATIFVPTENETLTAKMRQVLSPEEVRTIIDGMAGEESIWIEDENERKLRYKTILTSGNCHELVRLIRTLYLHQQEQKARGKKLHLADERFFKEAERMLYDEFAVVLNLRQDQVLPYIIRSIETQEA